MWLAPGFLVLAHLALLGIPLAGGLGCGGGVPYEYVALQLRTPDGGQGRVWVYTPERTERTDLEPNVRVDGLVIGRASPGTFLFLDLLAGTHQLEVEPPPGDAKPESSTRPGASLEFEVPANENVFVRLQLVEGAGDGARIEPRLQPRGGAVADMKGLEYRGDLLLLQTL